MELIAEIKRSSEENAGNPVVSSADLDVSLQNKAVVSWRHFNAALDSLKPSVRPEV